MESSTQKRALGLKDKIPDIRKTLETVQFLRSRDVRIAPLARPISFSGTSGAACRPDLTNYQAAF